MKKLHSIVLILLLCAVLTGCCLQHDWQEATCAAPKTCSKCGKTTGEALPHTWIDATCQVPKTCSVCQATEGDLGEHTWQEATCTTPKTCTLCSATEGEPMPHNWAEATMELPQTCVDCGATEGTAKNYFAMNGIEVEEVWPAEFDSVAVIWKGSKGNQEQIPVHNKDVQFYIPSQEKENVKEIAPRFRACFMAPRNSGGYWTDFNLFDLYTGQVIPLRDEDDYVVPLTIEGKEVDIRIQDWAISEWYAFKEDGIKTELYIWANIYVPKDYDGLVLAIGDLKYFGYNDEAWKNLQNNGMVPEDYFSRPEYYDGVTFYRLRPEQQSG